MKRFRWLLAAAALLGGAAPGLAQPSAPTKHLLLITESRGFRHSVVTRHVKLAPGLDAKTPPKVAGLDYQRDKSGNVRGATYSGRLDPLKGAKEITDGAGKVVATVQPALVEKTFAEMGKKTGLFDVVCSQDSRAELTGDNLKKFDAVWFYTTGELPISDGQKADLLGFVRAGKGFGGSHSAADTFYKWREYGELIGAYFAGHPSGYQQIRVLVEDNNHPATRHLGKEFAIKDEIYQYRDPKGAKGLTIRPLMRIDMKSTKNLWRKDENNPLAWSKDYGKGRVFYTALGHAEHVWADPRYQQHVLGALRYLFRVEDAGPRTRESK